MKTVEEIEQLANEWSDDYEKGVLKKFYFWAYRDIAKRSYIVAYTKCQQDMTDKKYTEEDIINIVNKSRETGLTAEYLILSLNKQN